ncbi:MAG: RNA chaperone Hfq [Sphingomicrobium sp.]
MADKPPTLQDNFLNECRRSKTPVTIFLIKGVKLIGIITWFDAFSVLLRRDGIAQLIYKHAISTIMPATPPALGAAGEGQAKGKPALQDLFLEAAERGREPLTLYLVNGVMLEGSVAGHDQFSLLLARAGQVQLIYKHAVSTIQPPNPLDLGGREDPDDLGEGR